MRFTCSNQAGKGGGAATLLWARVTLTPTQDGSQWLGGKAGAPGCCSICCCRQEVCAQTLHRSHSIIISPSSWVTPQGQATTESSDWMVPAQHGERHLGVCALSCVLVRDAEAVQRAASRAVSAGGAVARASDGATQGCGGWAAPAQRGRQHVRSSCFAQVELVISKAAHLHRHHLWPPAPPPPPSPRCHQTHCTCEGVIKKVMKGVSKGVSKGVIESLYLQRSGRRRGGGGASVA